MFPVLWQHWKQRPVRFLLTLISLILSTATLVGILVASHNARTSFRELSNSIQGLPSIDIVNSAGGRFEQSLLDGITQNDEKRTGLPTLIRGTIVRFMDQKVRGIAIGLPLTDTDRSTREFLQKTLELDEASWPDADECVMSSLFASNLGIEEGDSIQCLFRRGFKKLVVRKIIPFGAWNRVASEPGIMVDLQWLQRATALPTQIDRYRIFFDEDDKAAFQNAKAEYGDRIAKELMVQERTNSVGVADDLLKSTELGLSFASALAVAMAAYILLNTTRMNLAERRPYFAILRCLGATTWQMDFAILMEAFLLSSIGVVFGLISGCFLGAVMSKVLGAVLQAPPASYSVPWLVLLLVALFIPSLNLLVVWVVRKQQDAISPLESFREPTIVENNKLPWRSIGQGMALYCFSLFLLYLVQQEQLPAQWGVFAGLLALVAYLRWLPLGLIPLVWCVDRLAKTRFGFPIELAKFQLVRRPERTSLNAGFLVISLCGAVGLGQSLMSNTAEIKRWYYRALPGDFFLIGTRAPTIMIDSEDPLREMITELPGLQWANAMRFIRCQADQKPVLAIVREFPEKAPFPTEPKGMTNTDARVLVASDHVIIGSILAKKIGKKAGDLLTIAYEGRSFQIPIGGVNANFANGGMSLIMSRATAQRHFEVTGFEWYALSVAPEMLESTEESLKQVKELHGFELQRGNEMRQGVERTISGVTAGIWSVVFISFLTSGFGIATTLVMNMIEQARDFSLVRIVGAGRGQLMLTVLVQAWLLGVIGISFGMIGGVTTVMIIYSCSEALLGYTPEFEWNPTLMLLSMIGTALIVSLAAIVPAWNAAKINPVEHLTYE